MATDPNLTDEQRANLAKLAAYLRTLPAEYPDFAMDDFTATGERLANRAECGTAACAAGHGLHAGIAALPGETWMDYSERAFAPDDHSPSAWDWCFSGSWSDVDNTAHGAAARIEYMLACGVPANASTMRYGGDQADYRAVVSA